jgi:hypothetical protein
MEREIIKATEFDIGPLCYDYYWEGVETETYHEYFDEDGEPIKHHFSYDFKYITDELIYYDLEKGYEEIETIVKRLSDDKYFKINWFKSYYNENKYDNELIEVFPEEKTITIYK